MVASARGGNRMHAAVVGAAFAASAAALYSYFISGPLTAFWSCPNVTWQPYSTHHEVLTSAKIEEHRRNGPRHKLTIDRRSQLLLSEFDAVYDSKWPVIVTDIVHQWNASRWDSEFFAAHYLTESLFTKRSADGKLRNAEGQSLPLSAFLDFCRDGDIGVSWMYVEDEHFVRCHSDLLDDIGECVYTREDWFQLLPIDVRPWHAMFLWGSPGSRSSLHVDPYNWTGTNAVLRGRKRWKVFLPGQDSELKLAARQSGFPLDVLSYTSTLDTFDLSDDDSRQAVAQTAYIEFDQTPGELLIIPSGWPHQAYNVEETIAVSGQMMNKNNFRAVLEEVFKSGHLPRDSLTCDFHQLPPRDQVVNIARELQGQGQQKSEQHCHDRQLY